MAITPTLRLGLNKQDAGDQNWDVGLDDGFDEAESSFLIEYAGSDPNGSVVGKFLGQALYTTTNDIYWTCTVIGVAAVARWARVSGVLDLAGVVRISDTPTVITAALQALITLSGTTGLPVFIPAGTWLINSTIQLAANARVVGAGRDISIIKLDDVSNTTMFSSTVGASLSGFVMERLTIGGNRDLQTAPRAAYHAFDLDGGSFTFRDMLIRNIGGSGILMADIASGNDAAGALLENLRFLNMGVDGIVNEKSLTTRLSFTINNVMMDVIGLESSGGTGIRLISRFQLSNIHISGLNEHGKDLVGISLSFSGAAGVDAPTLSNIRVDGTGDQSIGLVLGQFCRSAAITGVALRNLEIGISLNGVGGGLTAKGADITGVTAISCGTGVSFGRYSESCQVQGNFESCPVGVKFTNPGAFYCKVHNSHFSGTKTTGVSLEGWLNKVVNCSFYDSFANVAISSGIAANRPLIDGAVFEDIALGNDVEDLAGNISTLRIINTEPAVPIDTTHYDTPLSVVSPAYTHLSLFPTTKILALQTATAGLYRIGNIGDGDGALWTGRKLLIYIPDTTVAEIKFADDSATYNVWSEVNQGAPPLYVKGLAYSTIKMQWFGAGDAPGAVAPQDKWSIPFDNLVGTI